MESILGILGWVLFIYSSYLYLKLKKDSQEVKSKDKGPKIVVIGGGTGQSVFLRGLKHYTKNITAIVTVAYDGGGSGALREDLGMLPPGDIRNCLLSLANIEPTMNEVMQYRFEEGSLKGQSFGNLFLAAMNGVYGSFEIAVYKMSEIFAITGKVLPVTLTDINLVAKLKNGDIIKGESRIPKEVKLKNTSIESVSLEPKNANTLEEVTKAILDADIIVIGPGSLYTSIMPNLLVEGVYDSIKKSDAKKVYVSNIMTQPGETDNYNALDHINAIIKHTGNNFIDYIIVNNEVISEKAFKKYKDDGASQVLLDKIQKKCLKNMNIKYIEDNFIELKNDYIRHNANKISEIIVDLALINHKTK